VPVIVAARFFPDLYLYAGSTELMTETALCLTFIVASLLVATLSDVHRRKEDELNEFRSRVESLVNNSPNMMSLKGLDGRFLLANRAYSRMLGVTEYAMVGRLVSDYFAPDDARRIQQQDEVVLIAWSRASSKKASPPVAPPSPCW
jgi:PAS domain-containing protein